MIERYSHPEMARVWTIENRTDQWLRVEQLVCQARFERGEIPAEANELIQTKASYDLKRMDEIEQVTHHDMVAFVRCVQETIGDDAGRYLHVGLTSTDVVDTGLSVQIQQACAVLKADVEKLLVTLEKLAKKYKLTPIMGRSHGMHAEPTSFGLKMALWIDEMRRNALRLDQARDQMAVGKISGAVGTHANVDPEIEEFVCTRLGLRAAPVSTQTLQRDRHAHFMATLAVLSGSLEKFATEIRHLQRTEVGEAEEPFEAGQTGSSAMPHKRNPRLSERVCGLSRVMRGYALAALEDVALWHERDISHSSVERIILPDGCLAMDYMLRTMNRILSGLVVKPERMKANLELLHGVVNSERVLHALIDTGLSRTDAYGLVQRAAHEAMDDGVSFRERLLAEPAIRERLSDTELDDLLGYDYHLKHVETAFRRIGLDS
ncbi:MAG TPA: adenylosuccinate lyase [Chloroflexota bacterium]|nr:adenylosuccinate lyase [Chloroflexota bacterium]